MNTAISANSSVRRIHRIPVLLAIPVSTDKRESTLAIYGGADSIHMKVMIYDFMSTLCRTYSKDDWRMYELINGGFYMAPSDNSRTYDLYWSENAFSGTLSADAAGIVSCLFAYRRLSVFSRCDRQSEHYKKLFMRLHAYACQHPESVLIKQAIDTEPVW